MDEVTITAISRDNCHLCDEAETIIASVMNEFSNVVMAKKNVEDDVEWRERYSDHVPVVLIDGREHSTLYVQSESLRRALVHAGGLLSEQKSE
jgi:glutaredoxin